MCWEQNGVRVCWEQRAVSSAPHCSAWEEEKSRGTSAQPAAWAKHFLSLSSARRETAFFAEQRSGAKSRVGWDGVGWDDPGEQRQSFTSLVAARGHGMGDLMLGQTPLVPSILTVYRTQRVGDIPPGLGMMAYLVWARQQRREQPAAGTAPPSSPPAHCVGCCSVSGCGPVLLHASRPAPVCRKPGVPVWGWFHPVPLQHHMPVGSGTLRGNGGSLGTMPCTRGVPVVHRWCGRSSEHCGITLLPTLIWDERG